MLENKTIILISETSKFIEMLKEFTPGNHIHQDSYSLSLSKKQDPHHFSDHCFIFDYREDSPASLHAFSQLTEQFVNIPIIAVLSENSGPPSEDEEFMIFLHNNEHLQTLLQKFIVHLTKKRATAEKFYSIFENSPDIMFIIDPDNLRILRTNHIVKEILGYETSEIIGKNYNELLPPETGSEIDSEDSTKIYGSVLETQGLKKKDGSICPMDVTWSIVDWDNKPAIFATLRDITERKNAEKTIAFMAYHDSLTGLPNRVQLCDFIENKIEFSKEMDLSFAVLFIDLDRFKTINDTLGHDIGDDLLKLVSMRLQSCVRAEDTVGRIGGDEFVIVVNNISSEEHAKNVADKILKTMSHPFHLAGKDLYVSASIGISLYPNDAMELENTLRNADMAMYLAKDMGRNNFQFYTDELNRRAQTRLDLENDLRNALEKNEFMLVYQPVIDPQSNKVTSAEALIRWNHPQQGIKAPQSFIPLAEEIGLIGKIGHWVLLNACIINKQWQDLYPDNPISIAVNISGLQFKDPGFLDEIKNILNLSGLNPKYLELELTESILMDDVETIIDRLHQIREMGISISIDDFGTGYSSLNYIRRFPLDILKIDRSFINDIDIGNEGVSIVRAIISLARNLGLDVIAEGVETDGQLQFLNSLNCRKIQGYFYHRPLISDGIQNLLKKSEETIVH
ncbi:MAG: EAL domain-containing protein [Spirochaetia bacterium]|nr:EAL domain-containing protein [Spirochaetia bacterium]